MKIQLADSIWLNDTGTCTIEHLAEVSGLSLADLQDLLESGVILPVDEEAKPLAFRLDYVVIARTARRLSEDFELDRHGTAVALTLLKRIRDLEAELQAVLAVRGGKHRQWS